MPWETYAHALDQWGHPLRSTDCEPPRFFLLADSCDAADKHRHIWVSNAWKPHGEVKSEPAFSGGFEEPGVRS